MAVSKFMKRIVSPDLNLDQVNKLGAGKKFAAHLHDFSHGINSDPVTQLAVILSALIHDVDHRGISNVQLGKENPAMAKRYRDKSLAEQNSFEISWDLFLSDHFKQLREFIFTSPDELVRFRQIVVNVVLATGRSIFIGAACFEWTNVLAFLFSPLSHDTYGRESYQASLTHPTYNM